MKIKFEKYSYETPAKISRKENGLYLSIISARKMINRFLVEKQMSMEGLAKTLKVDTKSLEAIFSIKVTSKSISKISLPLIGFYCLTKWE